MAAWLKIRTFDIKRTQFCAVLFFKVKLIWNITWSTSHFFFFPLRVLFAIFFPPLWYHLSIHLLFYAFFSFYLIVMQISFPLISPTSPTRLAFLHVKPASVFNFRNRSKLSFIKKRANYIYDSANLFLFSFIIISISNLED